MLKKLWSRWTVLTMMLLLVPIAALADYYTPGNPCRAERATFYDASWSTIVGVDEYICWDGHRKWGQTTNNIIHEDFGPCCTVCTANGVCGIEP